MSRRFPTLLRTVALVALGFPAACTVIPEGVRLVSQSDREIDIFVRPSEPTVIAFPTDVRSGFKGPFANCRDSYGTVHRQDNVVVIWALREVPTSGKKQIVRTKDEAEYSFRILPANESRNRDEWVSVSKESLKLCQKNSLCPKR